MQTHAKVVIIGGGVVGCSILFHLAKFGWKDVLLLERSELTSGSSWHAAGQIHTISSDPNISRLQGYTIKLYKESGEAVFEVRDEGPGIPAPEREKIFEAFYRGSDTPVAAVQGSGLGLSIVKEYLTLHRGRIEVLDGPGAHFRIRIPRRQAPGREAAA